MCSYLLKNLFIFVTITLFGSSCNYNPASISVDNSNPTEAAFGSQIQVCYPPNKESYAAMCASTDPQFIGNIEIVRQNLSPVYKAKAGASLRRLEHLWWNSNQSTWHITTEFAGIYGSVLSDPAICSNLDDNLLQVIVEELVNGVNTLVHYWRNVNHEWIRQTEIATLYLGSPAMISNRNLNAQGNHNLEVIFKPTYGANYFRHFTRINGIWSEKKISLPGVSIASNPSIAQTENGRIHLCFTTIDNYLMYYTTSGSTWTKRAQILGGDSRVRPAVVAYGNKITVFAEIWEDWNKKIRTWTLNSSGTLSPDNLTIYDGTSTFQYPSAVKLGTSTDQYIHFSFTQANPTTFCSHWKAQIQ